ncbi:hypothetical protein EUA76_01430 [TM7 phylum sp. oral taxon 350]|nr:hypothetical protein EUA76_01430 [TM7 phylum sp. oral taxon 350]
MFTNNYRVLFEDYSERHYIKKFKKDYGNQWLVTRKALVAQLSHIDQLVLNGRTNPPIHRTEDNKEWIVKHEFAVAGRKQSAKSSGNRVILYVNHNERIVRVLLLYHKNHLGKDTNETAIWQNIVKQEFKDLLAVFNL